jgi:hypothetical protein
MVALYLSAWLQKDRQGRGQCKSNFKRTERHTQIYIFYAYLLVTCVLVVNRLAKAEGHPELRRRWRTSGWKLCNSFDGFVSLKHF